MKEFKTALEAVVEPTDFVEFKIDDQVIKAYPPKDGQIAMVLTAVSKFSDRNTRLAGIIDFMCGVMDDDSRDYIVNRLMDRDDQFGLEEVNEIMEWLTEELTARPTQRQSGSTSLPKSDGQNSTPPTTASTSSDSLPIGS